MKRYLLAIDPGESTGIALGTFSNEDAYELVETWQPRGSAEGFLDWWDSGVLYEAKGDDWDGARDPIVAEKFVLRSAEKDGRVPNIEPKRIEGVLLALRLPVVYQHRWAKAGVRDQILKDHGLWQTGKKFDHPDGRDANDAIVHSLAYLKSKTHLPTLRRYWGPAA
jgi:hypothetical protein